MRISDWSSDVCSSDLFLRPGREAQILRRVLERHNSSLPPAALLRIWREMIAALYRLQAPVKIAVHAPNKSVARWDLARDYYGSTTSMQLCTTAMAVMRAISSQPLTLGVMTIPEDGEKATWRPRTAERRVGKESVRTGRSRWSPEY